ncbi:DNA-directed RNA polymerase subunit D [Methanoregula formicica]|uniref:DNA-directed RNA polymerase subunit Rpo3 n=1 Tax=Methanoregula formicica (strain DSM 22288 / NBRC 105244 / SMSP) TaxID=593750 RepID=L0HCN0_METFS|nr:DNA-directed RNA polymerase subunit D [Methanoregula formicica]AGB01556.1 DNA-directed RNA polymerase, alpha subunit/40 kD subunit [Methanoregula formicica SMSP]
MEIEFASLDDSLARFTLSGASPAFANAFRRAMIGEVPTLAIEDVRIYDNTSALFDEMLAHRLGLIPLKTDLSVYSTQDTCSCGGAGCPGCTATYTLSVEGPRMVTSSDLIPQDPGAAPVYDNIPIVKLTKGQKLVIEARAILNTGRAHAKWQSTLVCGYKNHPVITVSDVCDACGMCVEECPRDILVAKGKKVQVAEGKLPECSMCRLCERACLASGIGEEPAIKISAEPDRFIFVVESDGSLPAKEIMNRALSFIREQADELEQQLGELSGDEKK